MTTAWVFAFVAASSAATSAAIAGADGPQTFGDVGRLVREHDVGPKVVLSEVLARPHAYGLGSLSGLRGEITIVDGRAWLAYPPEKSGGEPRVVTGTGAEHEKAGFLVAGHVEPSAWRKLPLTEPTTDADLDATLARIARGGGLDGRELVFRIDGRADAMTLAIVDGRHVPPGPGSPETLKKANVLQTFKDADVVLVGFFSPAATTAYTHPGKHAHVHAVAPSKRATGHAQHFQLRPGAVLWLRTARGSPE
jgi:alpha-acetolactate decarboxylase